MSKKKSRSMINNNLGGNQIVYLDQPEKIDTIETYNVSANKIEVDKLVKIVQG